MYRLSLSILYYNQPDALKWQLSELKAYSSDIEILIIDDGSKKFPIEDLLHLIPRRIKVYKILQDKPWNIPGARNLSMHCASADWVIQLDIDQLIRTLEMRMLLTMDCSVGTYYSFNRVLPGGIHKPTAGSLLISKHDFNLVDGYDESFAGYYGYNDPYLKWKLRKHDVKNVLIQDLYVIDKSDIYSASSQRRFLFRNRMKFFYRRAINRYTAGEKLRFSWLRLQ